MKDLVVKVAPPNQPLQQTVVPQGHGIESGRRLGGTPAAERQGVRRMEYKIRICFLAFLIIISCDAFAYERDNCFPGKTHDLSSPSGTHRLIWKEPKDQHDEQ